jgi:hypothetical protein
MKRHGNNLSKHRSSAQNSSLGLLLDTRGRRALWAVYMVPATEEKSRADESRAEPSTEAGKKKSTAIASVYLNEMYTRSSS